jgi:type IV secretion system protein VirB1
MFETLTTLFATCAPHVHPETLRALIAVESAGNPYAVSLNRPEQLADAGVKVSDFYTRQPTSTADGLQRAHRLLSLGLTTSIGLAQINIEQAPHFQLTLAQLFDPCTNLTVAQRILMDCDRAQHHDRGNAKSRLHRTLSCYNAGNYETDYTNGYVARVVNAAARQSRTTQISQR